MRFRLPRFLRGAGEKPAGVPGPVDATAPEVPDARFNEGITLHRNGHLADAQRIYDSILVAVPDHFDTLRMRGLLALQGNDFISGLRYLDAALKVNPDDARVLSNRGAALQGLDRLGEALNSYDRCIALEPAASVGHFNRGVVLGQLRQLEAAIESYDRALLLAPDYADAHHNRAVILEDLGRLDEASASYLRVAAIQPESLNAHANLGNIFRKMGDYHRALQHCERAIALRPGFADNHAARGTILSNLHRPDDALVSYETAIFLQPDFAEAYSNRGHVLMTLKRPAEALSSFDKALSLRPGFADAHLNRGHALFELKRLDEALLDFDQVMATQPDFQDSLPGTILNVRMAMCDWRGFADALTAIEIGIRQRKPVVHPFPILGLSADRSLQRQCADIWVGRKFPPRPPVTMTRRAGQSDKIVLGYFSADFRGHAVAFLIAELIERHDRGRFQINAYAFGGDAGDAMRQRLAAAFDRFVDVSAMSDQDVAELARRDGVDIAIDLTGYTQNARTGIFPWRAAPIQVNFLGYPGTMAMDCMDYIVADATLIRDAHAGDYAEKIVRLPNAYQPNDRQRRISDRVYRKAELGLPEDAFVFCSFNNNFKITPDVFDVWMRILRRVDGAVLWLLEDNKWVRDNLRREAAARGVDPARLIFAPRFVMPEHLARQRAADLFLDTLPYNAHTTASDALWAGLPVLTRIGGTFAGRVAASLLRAIGLPELITETPGAYEELAVKLATDRDALAALKARLAANRLTHPLFDTALFARHIETAYTAMHARHLAGLPPDHIDVDRLDTSKLNMRRETDVP